MYRLQQGGNRKSAVIRWIGQWTVRVHILRVNDRGCAYEKADKGVEKSFPSRGRRKRGLRRGKHRSRGGKPRRSVKPPAPSTKGCSDRAMRHRERLFTAARRSQSRLLSSMERLRDVKNLRLFDEARSTSGDQRTSVWRSVKDKWSTARLHWPKDVRRLLFGATFVEFLLTLDPRHDGVTPTPLAPSKQLAPPLPPRGRGLSGGVNNQTYRPAWHVSSVVDYSQGESDHLGPDPCAWCRDEWISAGELGLPHARCLRIHSCVRRSPAIERENREKAKEERLHRSNARRLRRPNS